MYKRSFALLIVVFLSFNSLIAQDFSFNVFADVNQYSEDQYDEGNYFRHAATEMKRIALGEFAILPGDFHPPWTTFKDLREVIGNDYKLYPAIGNHELDEDEFIAWMKNYLAKLRVNHGPKNSELTTYSFDFENAHFVSLNFYYDGESDEKEPPELNGALMDWLENDLKASDKQFKFVFGHVPLVSLPDYESGRRRHKSGNLNEKDNYQRFVDILRWHKISAYFCGHTHDFSYAKINGIRQIDAGHMRGVGDEGALSTFLKVSVSNSHLVVEVFRLSGENYELTNKIKLN